MNYEISLDKMVESSNTNFFLSLQIFLAENADVSVDRRAHSSGRSENLSIVSSDSPENLLFRTVPVNKRVEISFLRFHFPRPSVYKMMIVAIFLDRKSKIIEHDG